ncbi:DUF669 domain-containing protein [Zooshikella ganghwensis]|uniref:DUF669 domain-containing protein n=1 Tax=Zooshikella ganghwensis TaxID=202772 RepID=A0A4P9VIR2_9GAMM|nr:DUF669 domain-containing protein [Zooshikella ganghwensis]RDH41572.1 DUF669 domain-containing protein [Zooshikella ganghwensis]
MASFGFQLNQYPADEGFTPIPAGDYPAIITEAGINANRANTGALMKVKFVITEGQYQNRSIYENFNISHPNPQAEEIGRKRLSALCTAIGYPDANDSDQLLNQACVISVGIRNNPQYGPQNEIKKFAPCAQQQVMQQPQQTQQQAPQQQPNITANTPPFYNQQQPNNGQGWG